MRSEALETPAPAVARETPGRRRRWITFLSIGISAGLLFLLYRSMDVRQIGRTLAQADTLMVLVSILAILPITVLRAMRFFWIAPAGSLPGIAEAVRLTLVSSALNVFVPAKAGDLAKSYFVARRSDTTAGVAIGIVVYERLCDMFALVTWCLIGWALARPDVAGLPVQFWLLLGGVGAVCALLVSSQAVADVLPSLVAGTARHPRLRRIRELAAGWPELLRTLRGRRRWIVFFSILLWLAHLSQIWMFTVALRVPVPFAACASLAAVALMAGQLPLTFAGLGTRDVALVVLLAGYMAAEPAAALGVLISTRNFLPPLVGVPLMWRYVSAAMEGDVSKAGPGRG